MSMDSKSLALFWILQILWRETDAYHPLTQEEMIEILRKEYGVTLERKAVAAKLQLLEDAGFQIDKVRRGEKDWDGNPAEKTGCYLHERQFEREELRFLIDCVVCNRYLPQNYAQGLIEKLLKQGNRYFENDSLSLLAAKNWGRTEDKRLFYHMNTLYSAIHNNTAVQLSIGHFQVAGSEVKKVVTSTPVVSPYTMMMFNQRYYLMGYNHNYEQISFHRVDHIVEVEAREDCLYKPIREIKGFENGIDFLRISTTMPFPFYGEAETVRFKAHKYIVDQVIDWFGKAARLKQLDEDFCEVTVKVSLPAMKIWAIQYAASVEILEPLSLRQEVGEELQKAAEKYRR